MPAAVKIPLNPEVAKELALNWELWLIFSAKFGGYDWEIDPLHRDSWVEERKAGEAEWLKEAKAKLLTLRQLHGELRNHVASGDLSMGVFYPERPTISAPSLESEAVK
jgi:hypothetical protein